MNDSKASRVVPNLSLLDSLLPETKEAVVAKVASKTRGLANLAHVNKEWHRLVNEMTCAKEMKELLIGFIEMAAHTPRSPRVIIEFVDAIRTLRMETFKYSGPVHDYGGNIGRGLALSLFDPQKDSNAGHLEFNIRLIGLLIKNVGWISMQECLNRNPTHSKDNALIIFELPLGKSFSCIHSFAVATALANTARVFVDLTHFLNTMNLSCIFSSYLNKPVATQESLAHVHFMAFLMKAAIPEEYAAQQRIIQKVYPGRELHRFNEAWRGERSVKFRTHMQRMYKENAANIDALIKMLERHPAAGR